MLAKAIADRKAILLFYREPEQDKYVKNDRYIKRILRPVYNLMHHRQKQTGFAVSFDLLDARPSKRAGLFVSTTVRLHEKIHNILSDWWAFRPS